jgi:hypothetical protein
LLSAGWDGQIVLYSLLDSHVKSKIKKQISGKFIYYNKLRILNFIRIY